jgi:hypothetical protein
MVFDLAVNRLHAQKAVIALTMQLKGQTGRFFVGPLLVQMLADGLA